MSDEIKAAGEPVKQEIDNRVLAIALAEMARNKVMAEMAAGLVPEILGVWAGDSSFKKMVAKIASGSVVKRLKAVSSQTGTSAWDDPDFVKRFADNIPALSSTFSRILSGTVETFGKLPQAERKYLLEKALAGLGEGASSAGKSATLLAQSINELHKTDPVLFAGPVIQGFRSFMENADFGEIAELVEGSSEEMKAVVSGTNEVIWQYPAKVLCLATLMPVAVNVLIYTLTETSGLINRMAPDIVADVSFSLLRNLDGKALGKLVNEGTEAVRKLHTGSALLGDPGIPQFTRELAVIMTDFVGSIDPVLLAKAKIALAEDAENIKTQYYEFIKKEPGIFLEGIARYSAVRNAGIRADLRKAAALDEIPAEKLNKAASKGLQELDAPALAETVNLYLGIANRFREASPGIASSLSSQFAGSVDQKEAGRAAQWIAGDAVGPLQPLIRATLPHLLNAICDSLERQDDEFQPGIDAALARLSNLLKRGDK